jgi:ribosomal-protein-alanine N-acetyltransferase
MTITSAPWSSTVPGTANHLLIQLPLSVISALANADLETANALSTPGLTLTPYLISERWVRVWKRRSAQIKADERDAIWTARVVVDSSTGNVVGIAGYVVLLSYLL